MKAIQEKETLKLSLLQNTQGKVGWAILWMLGIPLPVLLIFYFIRGCQ